MYRFHRRLLLLYLLQDVCRANLGEAPFSQSPIAVSIPSEITRLLLTLLGCRDAGLLLYERLFGLGAAMMSEGETYGGHKI